MGSKTDTKTAMPLLFKLFHLTLCCSCCWKKIITSFLSDDVHRISIQQLEKQVWGSFNRQGLWFVKQVSPLSSFWLLSSGKQGWQSGKDTFLQQVRQNIKIHSAAQFRWIGFVCFKGLRQGLFSFFQFTKANISSFQLLDCQSKICEIQCENTADAKTATLQAKLTIINLLKRTK